MSKVAPGPVCSESDAKAAGPVTVKLPAPDTVPPLWAKLAVVAALPSASVPPDTVKAWAKLEVELIVSDPPETTNLRLPAVRELTISTPVLWVTVCSLAVLITALSAEVGSRWGVQLALVAQLPSAFRFQIMVGVGMISSSGLN